MTLQQAVKKLVTVLTKPEIRNLSLPLDLGFALRDVEDASQHAEIVYVVLIHNSDGARVSVHLSVEGANAAVLAYVREQWDEKIEAPMPDDGTGAVTDYFHRLGMDESYEILDTVLGE